MSVYLPICCLRVGCSKVHACCDMVIIMLPMMSHDTHLIGLQIGCVDLIGTFGTFLLACLFGLQVSMQCSRLQL